MSGAPRRTSSKSPSEQQIQTSIARVLADIARLSECLNHLEGYSECLAEHFLTMSPEESDLLVNLIQRNRALANDLSLVGVRLAALELASSRGHTSSSEVKS
jgi:hypothetical protein